MNMTSTKNNQYKRLPKEYYWLKVAYPSVSSEKSMIFHSKKPRLIVPSQVFFLPAWNGFHADAKPLSTKAIGLPSWRWMDGELQKCAWKKLIRQRLLSHRKLSNQRKC